MFQPRTLKFLGAFISIFILLVIPAQIWPQYLDSPMGLVVAIPYISIYLFHSIGIPFLLQNNGACGWGWCAPIIFGWVFLGLFWLMVVWLFSAFIANLTNNKRKPR